MKKQIGFLGICMLCFAFTQAQTIGQFSMWNQNHYIVNPAAAGNLDYLDVAIGFRRQWAGIKDAPRTFYATGHTVLNRPKTFQRSAIRGSNTKEGIYKLGKRISKPMLKHAVGASMSSNEFGAFNKTEITLTYALHLPVYDDISLSFGISGGLNNFGFDESKATVIVDNDPVYNAYLMGENSNKFNVNAGTYLYSDKFFFGYSANQILQNELEIADIKTTSEVSNIALHHFLIGGYNFDLTNDFRLTPSVIAKKINPNPISIDINATLTYKQAMYIGATYRTSDAISLMAGFQFNHFLRAGYSYDYTLSDLNDRSNGSHEIFIGLTLF